MSNIHDLSLYQLSDQDLALVTGGGGEINIALTTPPVRGTIGLAYTTGKTTLGGNLALDGRNVSLGLTGAFNPSPKVSLEGYLRSDGRNYEAGIAGRIRFFQA